MAAKILTPLQATFLSFFSQDKGLAKRFYLSGGTALAQFYLQHRLSEDLDFFSQEEFGIVRIQSFLKKASLELKLSKIEYRNFMGLHTFFLRQASDMLKVDFSYYPFPPLEKNQEFQGLLVDSLRDIAVNKLQTIATRPRSRDFIDLYCIIKKTGWNIAMLRKDARNKFDHFIDSLHLGSRFLQAKDLKDYPKLLKPLEEKAWQGFFYKEAKKLGRQIID